MFNCCCYVTELIHKAVQTEPLQCNKHTIRPKLIHRSKVCLTRNDYNQITCTFYQLLSIRYKNNYNSITLVKGLTSPANLVVNFCLVHGRLL